MKPHRALLFPIATVLFACSPVPPPAEPSPVAGASSVAAASSATAAPPTAAPEEPPSARVAAVQPDNRESIPGVRAKILFTNPSKRACRLLGYKLFWAGKSKAIVLQDLSLQPGETRERWLKVGPEDGDVAALTPSSGRVEVKTDCGAP